MPRPRQQTPDARIAELASKGLGRDAIVAQLERDGTPIAPATVGRRLAELRSNSAPAKATGGAKAKPSAAKGPKATAPTAEPATDQPAVGGADVLDLDAVDIDHLPVELLMKASRRALAAFEAECLPGGNIVAADKLATVLEHFCKRLAEVRPPEKVDPVKDPANVGARREILARWELLRDPYEVSTPVVDQLQAHVDALRARSLETAAAP